MVIYWDRETPLYKQHSSIGWKLNNVVYCTSDSVYFQGFFEQIVKAGGQKKNHKPAVFTRFSIKKK